MGALTRVFLWVILANLYKFPGLVSASEQMHTYTDDEDLPPYSEFSGSGDSQSHEDETPRQSVISIEGATIDRGGKSSGKVISLSIPDTGGIQLQEKTKTDQNIGQSEVILDINPVKAETGLIDISSEKISDTKTKKSKAGKQSTPESRKSRKKAKKKITKRKKLKEKKIVKKPKKLAKALNLNTKSKSTIMLSNKGSERKKDKKNGDFHIRRNIDVNSHQDRPNKRRHRHNHHKKRWRKNMNSNRHGYGKKGIYKKRKLTYEDRWPGCFSKYQSCYRDNNCCNKNCRQFTWLSFGFCL